MGILNYFLTFLYIFAKFLHNIIKKVVILNLKQTRFIAIIGIFILNFIFHFAYDLLPNTLFSIFFPVNESIFEHQKLIFSSFVFYSIIDYFILKKNKLSTKNLLLATVVSALCGVGIFLIIWLPIFYKFGEKMILTFIILLIAIALTQIICYYILKSDKTIKYANTISIGIIIIIYIALAYLTYNPPKVEFFFDPINEKYGINTYRIK